MEPRIQYAKTSDGVSIVYHTIGEGPSFIWATGVASHLHFESRCGSQGLEPATRAFKSAIRAERITSVTSTES